MNDAADCPETCERALSSEARHRALLEYALDLIAVVDPAGIVRYVSPSIRRIGGYEVSETVGRCFLDFVHPEDRAAAADYFAASTPGAVQLTELRYRHRDGHWIVLEAFARNAEDDPLIGGRVINARDVTGRRLAERRLAKVKRLYALQGAIGSTIVHAQGTYELFVRACEAAVAHGGFRAACVVMAGADRVPEIAAGHGAPAAVFDTFQAWLSTPQAQRAPPCAAMRDGTPHWPEGAACAADPVARATGARSVAAVPILREGEVAGALALYAAEPDAFDEEERELVAGMGRELSFAVESFARDARRWAAEASLRDSQALLRSIFDGARDIIYVLDDDGLFVSLNPAFQQVCGWNEAEWTGRSYLDLIHPQDRDRARRIFEMVLAGASTTFEMRFARRDGTPWDAELSVAPLRRAGRTYLFGIARDVTERKAAEARIRMLAKFPQENPTAVMRVSPEGFVLYANPASRPLLEHWGIDEAMRLPAAPAADVLRALSAGRTVDAELRLPRHTFEMHFVPVAAEGYVNVYGVDITERRRAEERHARTFAELEHAQRVARIGSWSHDLATGETEWSRQLFEIMGLDPAQGTPRWDRQAPLYEPRSYERLRERVCGVIADLRPYSLEVEIVRPDGAHAWALVQGEAERGPDGKAARLRGTALDITERKRAQEALEFNHAVLRTQQEASIDGILIVDENDRVVSANGRFAQMWGLEAPPAPGADDRQVLERVLGRIVDSEAFVRRVKALYANRHETSRDEVELADGRVFDRYSAPLHAGERYLGRAWYFRDISERARFERALRESEMRFRAVVEQSLVGISIYEQWGYTYTNPRFREMFGYGAEELARLSPPDMMAPEWRAEIAETMRRRFTGEAPNVAFTARGMRKDGTFLDIEVHGSRMEIGGRVMLVSSVLDVTGRHAPAAAAG